MKKKEKIIKKLSDGTVAKVGMIVVNTDGLIGKIALIDLSKTIQHPNHILINLIDKGWTFSERAKGIHAIPIPSNYKTDKPVWFFNLYQTRKATPEERKQYYAELYAKNK